MDTSRYAEKTKSELIEMVRLANLVPLVQAISMTPAQLIEVLLRHHGNTTPTKLAPIKEARPQSARSKAYQPTGRQVQTGGQVSPGPGRPAPGRPAVRPVQPQTVAPVANTRPGEPVVATPVTPVVAPATATAESTTPVEPEVRRRGRPAKRAAIEVNVSQGRIVPVTPVKVAPTVAPIVSPTSLVAEVEAAVAAIPKRRGRPRKNPLPDGMTAPAVKATAPIVAQAIASVAATGDEPAAPVKRGRGRPKGSKNKKTLAKHGGVVTKTLAEVEAAERLERLANAQNSLYNSGNNQSHTTTELSPKPSNIVSLVNQGDLSSTGLSEKEVNPIKPINIQAEKQPQETPKYQGKYSEDKSSKWRDKKNRKDRRGEFNAQPKVESEGATTETEKTPAEIVTGILELMPEGFGFLRRENYLQGGGDVYIAPQYIRRYSLRNGDKVTGPCRPQRTEQERYPAIVYVKEVNGMAPEKMVRRPHFDKLTPIYPNERFVLETTRTELSTRIIDLMAPIGKGQRGMIVSPPKAGKTVLLQKIANAISINNPESKLIVLLIDERPEEVTDMQRSIKGEVVYSTFDKTPENHVKVTELVLERAERLVELGEDVIILLDSITRMGRAYNLSITPTGRTLSGGLDPGALYGPKRFFGAARNIEGGGSLTIVATALIDTGSRMDEVIFEEFKGTGNMEVYLDRKLSEKRIFPAIDINRSGTRREDLLLSKTQLDAVWTIRKALSQLDNGAVTEAIINVMQKTVSNEQFIGSINTSLNDKTNFETAPRQNKPNYNHGGNNGQGGSGGSGYPSRR